jgi:ABC-type cobalt transport system substrate-binding protein
MMRKNVLALVVVLASVPFLLHESARAQAAGASGQAAKAPTKSLKSRFAGAWKLVSIETRNAKGDVVPPAAGAANRTGYIIYDPAGYVAVSILPVTRTKNAAAQISADEAKAAIGGYAAYFGTFTPDEGGGFVTHHLEGSLNPGMARDQKRFFEFAGDKLTLQPPPAANGNKTRLTWQRMPDVNLTAEQRKFVGFWKLVSNERKDETGKVLGSNPGQTGYIIYTPAAFMMVQMMQPNRKPYAGSDPTPDEALQTIRTYTNYFGPFYVHQSDGYVIHDQVGTLNMGRIGPSPQQRWYQFVANRLLLQPPPTFTPDGHTTTGTITWEKATGVTGTR